MIQGLDGFLILLGGGGGYGEGAVYMTSGGFGFG